MSCSDQDQAMVIDHAEKIATIDSRSKSNTQRLNNIDKLTDNVQMLTQEFIKLVVNVEQQGKDLTKMVNTLERHEIKIEGIEKKMETKTTVAGLQSKIEDLERLVERMSYTERDKKLSEYEDMKKFITKILVGAAVLVVGSITIFGTVVLWSLAKSGSLPTI